MYNKFRSFIVVLCFVIFGLGALVLRYTVLIFPEFLIKDKNKKLKVCSKILRKSWQLFVLLLEFLGIIKLNKKETKLLKNIKNSIIVSTHPSFLDVLVLMSIIPDTTCFVAEKITRNPFFKGMADLLFIEESKNIEEWETKAINMLNYGFNVLIFPMGERHRKDEHPKIRKGAAFLAQKSKKNIVMLRLETSYEFLMKNQSILEIQNSPAEYKIEYSGEINIENMLLKYPDEITCKKEITNIITKNLYDKIII